MIIVEAVMNICAHLINSKLFFKFSTDSTTVPFLFAFTVGIYTDGYPSNTYRAIPAVFLIASVNETQTRMI